MNKEIFCTKCEKTHPVDHFFKNRNREYHPICRSYYKDIIDVYDSETFLPLLAALDIPYIPEVWQKTIKFCEEKHYPLSSVIRRYNVIMYLAAYRNLTFKDSQLKTKRQYFRRGVIYTTNLEKGKEQLQKIVDKKKAQGIHYDQMRQSQWAVDVYFDDMTWWHIALNFESARGLRWVDAYIDSDISIRYLKEIIMPKQIRDIETNELGEVYYF